MPVKHLKIFLITKQVDLSLVELSAKQVEGNNTKIELHKSEKTVYEEGIFILGINALNDPLFERVIKASVQTQSKLIIVTESQDPFLISNITRLGFSDIFIIPFELPKLRSLLKKMADNFIPDIFSNKDTEEKNDEIFKEIIGNSLRMLEVFDISKKIAANENINILITGETGTGKGLMAKAIHDLSPNYKSPFIDINCSALPANLLESELFGHMPGAFTDARVMKIGLFELAEDGTIFLDEIGDLSLDLQVKLLRAIDNRVIRRLGGTSDIPIKARIISATNRNLPQLILEEKFRNDLYHRLNAINIHMPALRDRGNDVIAIAEKLIKNACNRFNKPVYKIEDELKTFLVNYLWPGNVRELKNSIERAVLLSDHFLNLKYLFNSPTPEIENAFKGNEDKHSTIKLEIDYQSTDIQQVSKLYANKVLDKLNGNKSKAAKILGLSRPTLDKILNKNL